MDGGERSGHEREEATRRGRYRGTKAAERRMKAGREKQEVGRI